jgi:hypothetical protein
VGKSRDYKRYSTPMDFSDLKQKNGGKLKLPAALGAGF